MHLHGLDKVNINAIIGDHILPYIAIKIYDSPYVPNHLQIDGQWVGNANEKRTVLYIMALDSVTHLVCQGLQYYPL